MYSNRSNRSNRSSMSSMGNNSSSNSNSKINNMNKVDSINAFLDLIKDDILNSECILQADIRQLPSELVDEIHNIPDRVKYEVLEDGSLMRMFGRGNNKVIGYVGNYGGHYIVESAGDIGEVDETHKEEYEDKYKYVHAVKLVRVNNSEEIAAGDFIIIFPEVSLESIEEFLHTDEFILVMSDDRFVSVRYNNVFEHYGLSGLLKQSKHVFKVVVDRVLSTEVVL